LLKKLDKGPRASFNRGVSSNEDEKGSNKIEASKEDGGSKKGDKPQNDLTLSSIIAEQIQELIANAVKIQLGFDPQKSHLYTKPYRRGSTLFVCLTGTNLPISTNLMVEVTANNMLHTSLRRAIMRALAVTYW